MKIFFLSLLVFAVGVTSITGCGYESKNSELIGQVKRVVSLTPLLCENRIDADLSLGVLRNGTGSTSKEDVDLYIPTAALAATLKKAQETGAIVKITYDVPRFTFCKPRHWATNVEIIQ